MGPWRIWTAPFCLNLNRSNFRLEACTADLLMGLGSLGLLADVGLIAGIHMEGPFLSHARCGAQDPRFLLQPDLDRMDELLAAAGGHLGIPRRGSPAMGHLQAARRSSSTLSGGPSKQVWIRPLP